MSDDKTIPPESGPNGALENALIPSPAGAQKSNPASALRTRSEIYLPLFYYAAGFGIISLISNDLRRESAWWAGLFLGISLVIAARFVVKLARESLIRWELIGTGQRKLAAPKWLRMLVAATEILGTAGFCTWCTVWPIDPHDGL